MAESSGEANPDEFINDVKPYTNDNVYAATPSSGSGGGGDEEEEEDEKVATEDFRKIDIYLERPSEEENGKNVSDWVTQASSYNAENPVEGEALEPLVKSEKMDMDESNVGEEMAANEGDGLVENVKEEERLPTTFKIFVSNLPPGLLSSELMELFQQHGEVAECEIFAKNYAFVHMISEDAGLKALQELNGLDLRGCRINVKRSVQSGNPLNSTTGPVAKAKPEPVPEVNLEVGTYKIYIGNLMEDVTKEYVSKLLEPFGRIVEVEIYRNNAAFVHMETEEGGKKAIEELNGTILPEAAEDDKALVVTQSKNPEGPSIATIKLLVKNLSTDVSPEELRNLFTPYGLVLKVVLSKKILPKNNGCRTAIVHLEQFGNIRSAIKDLTGKEVGGTAIHVEATFDKPDKSDKFKPKATNQAPSYRPPPRPSVGKKDPHGWSPVTPAVPAYNEPPEWVPPNRMRLIPMPSEAELHRYPGRGRGMRLLRQGGPPPPPLMRQNPFETHNPFEAHNPWEQDQYNHYNNDGGYDEVLNDGFGGGYANYEEQEDYNEYDVYDWSQGQNQHRQQGNDYAPPPMKIPRNQSWNNSRKPGNNGQQNGNFGRGKQNNGFSNYNNKNNSNNNSNRGKKGLFPKMPSAEEFPKVPPSLMSMQVNKQVDQDWSSDLPLSNFSEFQSSCDQDFTSDEPTTSSSMNAVPFNYTQMKKKKSFNTNWQQKQNANFEPVNNQKGRGNKSGGKGRKGKPRRPGLGSAQQQIKTAHQSGNDEIKSANTTEPSSEPKEWQPASISSISTIGTGTASTSSSAYAPYYFQQNWSFSKGKQKQNNNKKPSAKQMKEAEEEQKRQYADYLKQKPWLYQAIPGTVKKVQK